MAGLSFEVSSGKIREMIDFIISQQLSDRNLWRLFVKQFDTVADCSDLGWRGEYWGKMMRGACLICKVTDDPQLYSILEESVESLLGAQDAEGRISTYDKATEFSGWDVWCRKYVALGLEYFLEICKNGSLKKSIVSALERHCDYIMTHIGPEEEGKIPITDTSGIWGGMNSSSIIKAYVILYEITHKKKYLNFAGYVLKEGGSKGFNIFEAAYKDEMKPYEYPYKKAYEMIACFEGALEYYKVTGEKKYLDSCERFAKAVIETDFTVVGGISSYHEIFNHSTEMQTVPITMVMQETCITVALMLYCVRLFRVTGRAGYLDYVERMFYNAYAGTLNTDGTDSDGGLPFDSYSPLIESRRGREVGGKKFIDDDRFYGCCASIGAAGLGVFLDSAIRPEKDSVCIEFFMPCRIVYRTDLQEITIEQRTEYPFKNTVEFTLHMKTSERLALRFRIPQWCKKVTLSSGVDGCRYIYEKEYIVSEGIWHDGDYLRLEMDMPYETEIRDTLSPRAPCFAVRKGPVVFAADKRYCQTKGVYEGDPRTFVYGECPDGNGKYMIEFTDWAGRNGILLPYADAGKTWKEDSAVTCWFKCDLHSEEVRFSGD